MGVFSADRDTDIDGLVVSAVLFHSTQQQLAATFHPVLADATGMRVMPGRGMERKDAMDLLRTLVGERSESIHWTPENVLAHGDRCLAWFVRGRVRPMFFRAERKQTVKLEVAWPTLVFLAGSGWVKVAALRSPRRPGLRSKLYHAPLWNTSQDGSVCLGSARVPELSGFEAMKEYEAAIYDTMFSHPNFRGNLDYTPPGKERSQDAAYMRFWREHARSRAPQFPKERLVEMGKTVGEFLGVTPAVHGASPLRARAD